MKKSFLPLLIFSAVIGFTACQKDNDKKTDTDIATHSDDQEQFSAEMDAVANDANVALEANSSFTGRLDGVQDMDGIICDATVSVNTASNPMTITITYNGSTCVGTNHTRTGVVVLSAAQGTQWKNAGASVTATFQNLKVTRTSDNKSITINGSQTYTNVSGGLLLNLVNIPNGITHSITSSGLSITFPNGAQRTWQVAKQRHFSYSNGLVISGTGTHTEGNVTNIAEWGTNRFGGAFTTAITSPIIVRQDCSFRITSGTVVHHAPLVDATVTFGLDASGNPTSCPGTGTYYFKAVWTAANGGSLSVIWPY